MKPNQAELYAAQVSQAITSLFDEENENYQYDLSEIDATKFFTGLIMGSLLIFNRLTSEDKDLLDYLSLQQRLVFQYLQENGKEKGNIQ